MTQQSIEPNKADISPNDGAGAVAPPPSGGSWLDRYFRISQRGSTVGREVRGGITTFMAMAYIILLNPVILSSAQDVTGAQLSIAELTTATALAAAVTTIAMGFLGNVPLALAAGLSVSAVMAFQVAPQMTWGNAWAMCIIYGAIIVLLVVTGLREMIMNAIPLAIKHAITMGIGLFVCLIGLVQAGFVTSMPGDGGVAGAKPIQLGTKDMLTGWPVVCFAVTVLLIFALLVRKVPGAILIGIVGGTVFAAIVHQVAGLSTKDWGLNSPTIDGSPFSSPDFGLFGSVSFSGIGDISAITVGVIVFTLVLAGFFDAIGTIIGIGQQAGLADKDGKMPGLNKALAIDGAGGVVGGVAGASGQTVFVESTAGVGDGARTGLASVITGLGFALCLFFTPLAQVIPTQVAAAALVVIGSLMMSNAKHIDWNDQATSIPVFLTTVLMPFTYSITAGIAAGIIAHVLIKVVTGRRREIGWLMWVLALIFLAFFSLNAIEGWLGLH
ncbi:NCS2 family permease [Streptomyces indicus]|uniref:Putative MFS transporter, AGZA family, xanthine/uracil permease n=1 Tax=Streptomyces indicus TaxID=417292 RepID=A0A1G8V490_9ACTN|nr:NCS2 family permease [Streptomyces indicus]SDJ60789.1 putative MFS transporter, AGZA family, xanthine/uracil permease [Streptomyces indicus]